MYAHYGVVALDWLTPDEVAIPVGIFRLLEATMLRPQPLQEGFEGFRETVVGCCLGGPAGVTTSLWDLEEGEQRDSRGLVLIRDVRVVPSGGESACAAAQSVQVVLPEVDRVELNVVLDVRTGRLQVVSRRAEQDRKVANLHEHEDGQSTGRIPFASRVRCP